MVYVQTLTSVPGFVIGLCRNASRDLIVKCSTAVASVPTYRLNHSNTSLCTCVVSIRLNTLNCVLILIQVHQLPFCFTQIYVFQSNVFYLPHCMCRVLSLHVIAKSDSLGRVIFSTYTTQTQEAKHQCRQWNSNPRSQQSSGLRPTPQTAQPAGSARSMFIHRDYRRVTDHGQCSSVHVTLHLVKTLQFSFRMTACLGRTCLNRFVLSTNKNEVS